MFDLGDYNLATLTSLIGPAMRIMTMIGAIRDAVLPWPASGALRGLGLAVLEAHVAAARSLCDDLG